MVLTPISFFICEMEDLEILGERCLDRPHGVVKKISNFRSEGLFLLVLLFTESDSA